MNYSEWKWLNEITYRYAAAGAVQGNVYQVASESGSLCTVTCPKWDHGNWKRSLADLTALYEQISRTAVRAKNKELHVPLLGDESFRQTILQEGSENCISLPEEKHMFL